MKVTATHKYGADVDTVYKAFSDPGFYQKKFSAVGARNIQVVEKKKKGSAFLIKTKREVASQAPGMLKKFLGEWNTLVQSESWQADGKGYLNELDIASPGVPVSIEGTMKLQPSAGGCVNKLSFEVECSVPFVGGKLEAFIADDMKKVLAEEYGFIKAYLAKQAV